MRRGWGTTSPNWSPNRECGCGKGTHSLWKFAVHKQSWSRWWFLLMTTRESSPPFAYDRRRILMDQPTQTLFVTPCGQRSANCVQRRLAAVSPYCMILHALMVSPPWPLRSTITGGKPFPTHLIVPIQVPWTTISSLSSKCLSGESILARSKSCHLPWPEKCEHCGRIAF